MESQHPQDGGLPEGQRHEEHLNILRQRAQTLSYYLGELLFTLVGGKWTTNT